MTIYFISQAKRVFCGMDHVKNATSVFIYVFILITIATHNTIGGTDLGNEHHNVVNYDFVYDFGITYFFYITGDCMIFVNVNYLKDLKEQVIHHYLGGVNKRAGLRHFCVFIGINDG